MSYQFKMEDKTPTFNTASDILVNTTTASCSTSENCIIDRNGNTISITDSVFSPLAPPFQYRGNNGLLNYLAQQDPRAADISPSASEIDGEMFMNRANGNDINNNIIIDEELLSNNNFFMGGVRPETVASSNLWGERSGSSSYGARDGDMMDTFDFLIKSLSSANNYVSMLTREQLSVLRAIRPSLLYELLQEVAKVRNDKRMRRALPTECAFCKNNGENEECYTTHALKDTRGRVTCPVLRAFQCPRCGATGERAHTIKYCPERTDGGFERSGSYGARRRLSSSSSSLLLGVGAQTPVPNSTQASSWKDFGLN